MAAAVLSTRLKEQRLPLIAGSLTFTTLMALVPLLTVVLALFSAFPQFSGFQVALEKYFLQSLVPDNIAKPVLSALTQFALKAKRIGGLGLVLLGAIALALMFTIDRTLNAIWRVQRIRPLSQRLLIYWSALTLGPLVLGLSLSMTSYALTASSGVMRSLPGGLGVVLALLEYTLITASLAGLYRYVPNTEVRWRHALLGAVLAGLAFEGAKEVLAWYVTQVPAYALIYGAFAALPVLLLWIYVSWLVVLLGAVLAAEAPAMGRGAQPWPRKPGAEWVLALEVLRVLSAAKKLESGGWSLGVISQQLNAHPREVEAVIQVLIDLDWVGRLEEDEPARLVLLVDPETTLVQPLFDALMLSREALARSKLPIQNVLGGNRLHLSQFLST